MVVLTRAIAVGIEKSGQILDLEVVWWLNDRGVRGIKADTQVSGLRV